MSELSANLPVSESLILTGFGMFLGCFAGLLSCILKSRCTSISCGCFKIERDVIPADTLQNVNIAIPTSTNN